MVGNTFVLEITLQNDWGKRFRKTGFTLPLINRFRSVPDFFILLWLTPDDFSHEREMSRTGKG